MSRRTKGREARGYKPKGAPAAIAAPAAGEPWRDSGLVRDCLLGLLLFAALLLAYRPALQGQPIWDDQAHLTKPALRSWKGLARIWFDLGATQQYYPVTHSFFWVEHRLWGDWYEGYHLVNILLLALSALLLVRILRWWDIPGPWLAAVLWAFHPLQVESVAWMSELKNTLSGFFYFASALAYFRFHRDRSPRAWFAALGLFVAGLLSKSAIDTLPAALLLLFYWKYGTVSLRRDVRPLIPFFAAAIGSGLFTAWVERTFIGARGDDYRFSMIERVLIAGRDFWFYLGKLLWPADLIFVYPRWQISASVWPLYLYPALAALLAGILFAMRKRWGRGPLVAVLFFAGTLFPALGFVNVFPFRYSFVADHFQYLAGIGPLVLLAAGAAVAFSSWPERAGQLQASLCVASMAILGAMTFNQCRMYRDVETLWNVTLARNPGAWMAHNNLGTLLLAQGRNQEASSHFFEVLRVNPNDAETRNNFGLALFKSGKTDQAIAQYQLALRINPNLAPPHCNLGNAMLQQGRIGEAVLQYQEALRIQPTFAEAHNNLGLAFFRQGRSEEAAVEFRAALQAQPVYVDALKGLGDALLRQGLASEAILPYRQAIDLTPADPDVHSNLADALLQQGDSQEAIAEYREALRLNPALAGTCCNLGLALLQQGDAVDAIAFAEKAVNLAPDDPRIENGLAWMLATAPQASLRDGPRALQLALKAAGAAGEDNPVVLRTLAAAYAQAGKYPAALQTAQKALQAAQYQSAADLVVTLRKEIRLYQAGQPYQ